MLSRPPSPGNPRPPRLKTPPPCCVLPDLLVLFLCLVHIVESASANPYLLSVISCFTLWVSSLIPGTLTPTWSGVPIDLITCPALIGCTCGVPCVCIYSLFSLCQVPDRFDSRVACQPAVFCATVNLGELFEKSFERFVLSCKITF